MFQSSSTASGMRPRQASSACSPASASEISNSSPSRIRRATLRMTLESSTTRQVFIAASLFTFAGVAAPSYHFNRQQDLAAAHAATGSAPMSSTRSTSRTTRSLPSSRWTPAATRARRASRLTGLSSRLAVMSLSTSPIASIRRPYDSPLHSTPMAMRARPSSSAGRPRRRRMSIAVTMRPRRLSTPATSGGASGTRVIRSGMKTSCTRKIGMPKSWPPIVAVTYSMMFSVAFMELLRPSLSRRASHFGGLLLERRDEALTVELGHVVVKPNLASALDRVWGHQGREADDRQLCRMRIGAHLRGELEAVHARHFDIGDDDVEAPALLDQRQRLRRGGIRGDGIAG